MRWKRTDLYGECNLKGAPVDTFTTECCAFCVNPECTRSSFGKSKFDNRVATWYERLFLNPPSMDPSDPRFKTIASQKFLVLNPALMVNDWIDPREDPPSSLIETNLVSKADVFPESIPSIRKLNIEPKAAIVPTEPKAATVPKDAIEPIISLPDPTPQPKEKPKVLDNLPLNTSVQKEQMLPQGKKDRKDSWDAPIPTNDTSNIKVVKPGAKIKIS